VSSVRLAFEAARQMLAAPSSFAKIDRTRTYCVLKECFLFPIQRSPLSIYQRIFASTVISSRPIARSTRVAK